LLGCLPHRPARRRPQGCFQVIPASGLN
jgi:hypothetical protein